MDKATSDPLVGKTVAQYEVVAKLGGGGMGVVYAARDIRLGRRVALKFLPPQWSHDESAKQRFIREAQAASSTDHRNICTIHDIETAEDGQLFLVMAYYDGQTLKQRLENGGALPVDEAIDIAAQVAEGLAKAHAQGVVHRDIKPGNLMLTEDGVKILDFGLAKFADSRLKLTLEGSTLGTIAYMSPEQARGEEADARSDIWSTGVVLYEMLTGDVPFKGGYPEAIAHAIKTETPKPLRSPDRATAPAVTEALEQLVFRALHKNPNVRFQTARDLARALRLLQGRTVPLDLRTEPLPAVAQATSPVFHPAPWWKTQTAITTAAVLAVVLVGIPLWLLRPVDRVPVAIAPVANHSGEPGLDEYRLALTEMLIEELGDSPTIRVTPYLRLVEILRRFMIGAGDVSSREAIQAIAAQGGIRFVIVPTLVYRDDKWLGQAEIRNVETGTNVSTYETEGITSSLPKETASRLVASLGEGIQRYFKPRWIDRAYRPSGTRFGTIEMARAFEEGLRNHDRMEYAASLQAFRRATHEDPQRAVAHAWVGRVLLLMGQEREAEAASQRAKQLVTSETAAADALVIDATLAESRRDPVAAEAGYRQLARLKPSDQWALFELADFLRRQFRNEEAIEAFHEVLRLDSGYIRPHLLLCQLYTRRNELPLAQQACRTALERYRAIGNRPGEAQALLYLAEVRRFQGGDGLAEAANHVESARAIFQKVGGPYSLTRVFQFAGTVAFSSRKYPEAVRSFEQALSGAREVGNRQLEGTLLMNLGVTHLNLGHRRQALEYYAQSRDFYERVGDPRRAAQQEVNIAGLLVDHGTDQGEVLRRVSNARATLRKLGDVDFELVATQVQAASYRYVGRHQEAIRELRGALNIAAERQLGNRIVSLTIDIARSHLDLNEYEQARMVLEKILATDAGRDDPHARIQLGRVQARLGNFDSAKALIESALADLETRSLAEFIPLAHFALGELSYEAGTFDEARQHFARGAAFWTADLADVESIESRCYLGLLDTLRASVNAAQDRLEMLSQSIEQAQRMGRVLLAARCRLHLARIYFNERRVQDALDSLNALPTDSDQAFGPEFRAQAHYWRSQMLMARGDPAGAQHEANAARKLIEDLRNSLPSSYRDGLSSRPEIRVIG